MSYREWLYAELVNDGVIDDDDTDLESLNKNDLFSDTELEMDDFDNYAEQFAEHCRDLGVEPDWDLPDM